MPPIHPSHTESNTRARILEAAELLVAERGFDAVSLRDITHAAGVNLAAVSYHFGSREGLIDDIISTAMRRLLQQRLDMLDAAEASSPNGIATVEQIADALVRPMLHSVKRTPAAEKLFFKFMGRCMTERADAFPAAIMPLFVESTQRLAMAMQQALPHLSPEEVWWRINFTSGALTSALIHGDLVQKLSGMDDSPDMESLLQHIIHFSAAGLRASSLKPQPKGRAKSAKVTAALAALALLWIPSCHTPPAPDRMGETPTPTPASWSATKEAKAGIDDAWLSRFGDTQLTALVDEAEKNSPDLRAAAARLDQARGAFRVESTSDKPIVDLGFQPSRSKRNFIGFPAFGGAPTNEVSSITFNSFGLSLPVTWEADVWGRLRNGRSAARATLESANAEQQAARISMAAQVARGFFALAEAQSQQALASEAQSTFEKTAEAVKERFKGGAEQGGMAAQLRLAESDVATAKAAVEERKQMVNSLSRQLEILVGRYPAGALRANKSLPTMPSRPPAGLPSELLLRRPDVLSAERQLASQGMRIREAWKALYPRFSLTGSVGTSTDALKNILNSDFGIWQLGANIVQPIFYGGRVMAEVDIRYGKDRELAAQLHKTMLKAFAEVENALSAEGELARREAAVRQASSLAEEAYQAANADYRDGVGDMLTVLTAQARAVNARSQIVALQRARLDNRVQLHLALGGDYKPKAAATSASPATATEPSRGAGLKSFLTRFKK